jgi:hypothetical protein
VSEGVGSYQGSHATRQDILDKIAVEVVNNSSLSEFLRKFADAWLTADAENKEILRPAWLAIIDKFSLKPTRGEG